MRATLPLSLIGLLILSGCSTTASFTAFHPADIAPEQIGDVAIMPFSGPVELATAAQQGLQEKLADGRQQQVIGADTMARLTGDAPADTPSTTLAAIERARQLGVKTIVTGSVDKQLDLGHHIGGHAIRMGDPSVHVAMNLRMIDVTNGNTLLYKDVARTYEGELKETDATDLTSDQVALRLVSECVDEVAGMLAAREETVRVELAQPTFSMVAADIRRGNRLARQGAWREASVVWEEILRSDTSNHAVLYNLGLAHEALGEPGRAKELYAAALREDDDQKYAAAMSRLRDVEPAATVSRETIATARPAGEPDRDLALVENLAVEPTTVPTPTKPLAPAPIQAYPNTGFAAIEQILPAAAGRATIPAVYPSPSPHRPATTETRPVRTATLAPTVPLR